MYSTTYFTIISTVRYGKINDNLSLGCFTMICTLLSFTGHFGSSKVQTSRIGTNATYVFYRQSADSVTTMCVYKTNMYI